jgi:hypothetical protein
VDVVGERVLPTVGQREAAGHSSSVANEEEVQRGSGAVVDVMPHWDPLHQNRTVAVVAGEYRGGDWRRRTGGRVGDGRLTRGGVDTLSNLHQHRLRLAQMV